MKIGMLKAGMLVRFPATTAHPEGVLQHMRTCLKVNPGDIFKIHTISRYQGKTDKPFHNLIALTGKDFSQHSSLCQPIGDLSAKMEEALECVEYVPNDDEPLFTQPHTTMSVVQFFRDLGRSKTDKLMREKGLEDPIGIPTPSGIALLNEFLYTKHREELKTLVESYVKEEKDKK